MVLEKLGSSLYDAIRKIIRAPVVDAELVKELIRDFQRALLRTSRSGPSTRSCPLASAGGSTSSRSSTILSQTSSARSRHPSTSGQAGRTS
jgi:hypothetical protein